MSKTFVYDRFDCTNGGSQHCYGCYTMDASSDGDYVRAEDAINREAVLQAEILALQVQLKDARQAASAVSVEQIRMAMILTPAYSDDGDYQHWIRMGRSVLALVKAPKEPA